MVTKSIHIAFTILTLLSITLHLVVGHGTHKISKCICLRANKPDGDAEVDIKSIKVLLIYKFGAIVVTLIASAAGVILPILGKKIAALCPDKGTFLLVKAYSAGIILCTAFVHILPKAYECLTSPCLGEDSAWANFPFTSLAVMLGALLTLMVNSIGSRQFRKADQVQHFDVAMDVYNHDHSPLPQAISEELVKIFMLKPLTQFPKWSLQTPTKPPQLLEFKKEASQLIFWWIIRGFDQVILGVREEGMLEFGWPMSEAGLVMGEMERVPDF
ncbi:Zinc transporter 1 [Bienertia sinuspersici]